MDFTPILRPYFIRVSEKTELWQQRGMDVQLSVLRSLLKRGCHCEVGQRFGFKDLVGLRNLYIRYADRLPMIGYEEIRHDVMRMVKGEKNVLWKGKCVDFAQSSGTSGGKSKYIPVTADSLRNCHYKGAQYPVAHYLRNHPESKLFSGKGLILGGSFANELNLADSRVAVGDLSATLINRISPIVNFFRIPEKKVALMTDWKEKLPAIVEKARRENITNLSGVPSWFLTVCKEILKAERKGNLNEVWPNLEVFFHGGISFAPYRDLYNGITDPGKIHFVENYNASEGFFAAQNDDSDPSMLLILDNDIFYEFLAPGKSEPLPMWEVEKGRVYELLISSSNGLWRYHTGDTVRVEQTSPLKITVAGRTKCFINAFGEELMEENAEKAISLTCRELKATVLNYTAAPVFASDRRRGKHQWFIEWDKAPYDKNEFAALLDLNLRKLNSDYDAKRQNTIFLDPLEIVDVPHGVFNEWLKAVGNGKLGGQRKVPRLANDRRVADSIQSLLIRFK